MKRSLYLSVGEGALHALMVGLSESYLGALEVELHHGATDLALLSSLPLLCGALAQPFAPWLASWLGSERRLVVASAALQALAHLGFVHLALGEVRALVPLLAVKLLFFTSGLIAAPAWSAWMLRLTPGADRARFFARRAAVTQLALLAASSAAGLYLGRAEGLRPRLEAFALLHILAMVARLASAVLLALKSDGGPPEARGGPIREVLGRLHAALLESPWSLPLSLSLVLASAQVAGPFFTPFVLDELRLGYRSLAALQATALLGKSLTFLECPRLAARFGLGRMLSVGAIGAALLPVTWLALRDPAGLLAAQLGGGIAWALVEFASFQLLLAAAPRRHHAEYLALAGAASGLAQLAGAMLGSTLLGKLQLGTHAVFVTSAILRLLAASLLVLGPRRAGSSTRAPRRRARGPSGPSTKLGL